MSTPWRSLLRQLFHPKKVYIPNLAMRTFPTSTTIHVPTRSKCVGHFQHENHEGVSRSVSRVRRSSTTTATSWCFWELQEGVFKEVRTWPLLVLHSSRTLLWCYVENHWSEFRYSDIDMAQVIEKGIRGGISMITTRHSEANNKYMGDH